MTDPKTRSRRGRRLPHCRLRRHAAGLGGVEYLLVALIVLALAITLVMAVVKPSG